MLHVSGSICHVIQSCTFLSIINSIYSLIYFYPAPFQASQRVLSCVLLSAFILCVPTCQMLISVPCMASCCCFSRSLLLTEALCAFFVAVHVSVCTSAHLHLCVQREHFLCIVTWCLLSLQFTCRFVSCSQLIFPL